MPRPIVEIDVFSPEVLVPSGGDPRTAGSVEAPFQALADRTHNLKLSVDAMGGRNGVTRIRTVANIAALKALTGVPLGEVVLVRDQGIYERSAPSLMAEPWGVAGTDGVSYWRHAMSNMHGVSEAWSLVARNGLRQIDGETFGSNTLNGELTLGPNALIRPRIFIGPNEDVTIENGKYDIVISGSLTADHAYKLTDTGAAIDSLIRVVASKQPGKIFVVNDSNTPLATLDHGPTDDNVPYKWSALFIYRPITGWTRIG